MLLTRLAGRTALRCAALLLAVPAGLHAQAVRVFSTATSAAAAPAIRCGGSPFLFCLSAYADYTASTGLLTLRVNNVSPNAGNGTSTGSVFTEVGFGNLTGYTLAGGSAAGDGQWSLVADNTYNGYNGVGLANNNPGLVGGRVAGNVYTTGLTANDFTVFNFYLRTGGGANASAPTLAAVTADFADVRLAVHDQGGGLNGCAGSAKMTVGNYLNNGGATTSSAVTCGPTTVPPVTANVVPEPASVALTGAGLAGLFAAARRRRRG